MRPEVYPPCPDNPDACARVREGEQHPAHGWGWRAGQPIQCPGLLAPSAVA